MENRNTIPTSQPLPIQILDNNRKSTVMLKNYLQYAWASIRRNKIFSFINICGLALGMSLCMLIITIIKDQLGYDRFHPNADRTFRINTEALRKNGGTEPYASSPLP